MRPVGHFQGVPYAVGLAPRAKDYLVIGVIMIIAVMISLDAAPARAQSLNFASENSDEPIEIFAEDGIEWEQEAHTFTARGNARAVRGAVVVRGDVLRAYYRDKTGGGAEIRRLDAEGHVHITTPAEEAFGETATYDVGKSILVLRGSKVRLIAGDDTISANQQLELWENKKMAVARGNAYAVRQDRRLRANVLTAHYRKNKAGKSEVYRVEAFGEVYILLAKDIVTADRGIYNVESGIATLTGSVKITRNQNQLNGCSAEVNLKTGFSKLNSCGSTKSGKERVRGLLQPGGVKKN